VGQRRGLGMSAPEPLYVVRVDRERNVVVVGEDDELLEKELTCRVDWLDDSVSCPSDGARDGLCAQIRSRQTAQPVESVDAEGGVARVAFCEPQRAIAPGQTIAFYDGPVVVGAGVIDSAGCLS